MFQFRFYAMVQNSNRDNLKSVVSSALAIIYLIALKGKKSTIILSNSLSAKINFTSNLKTVCRDIQKRVSNKPIRTQGIGLAIAGSLANLYHRPMILQRYRSNIIGKA